MDRATTRKLRLVQISWLLGLLVSGKGAAQISPDVTLPNPSQITPNGNIFIIEGGTERGNNLFHSFQNFSLPTGLEATFNNALSIENIFSRVTGNSFSYIDGLIRANGTANLFFLNPNGLIFGPNARLNIGGSFLASTASTINFADGTQFSTTPSSIPPLLSVSTPVGLEFGNSAGKIQVQGIGHNLTGTPVPVTGRNPSVGLQVPSGKTLALVGGEVSLEGGVLTAEGGRIELGSVGNGAINLKPSSAGWSLNYDGVSSFKDIHLSRRALADVSGLGSGSIGVQGRSILLQEGSVILLQNQGKLPGGTLSIKASEFLEISGTDPVARIAGSLRSETVGAGQGGNILISTERLVLQAGGQINAFTFSTAPSGNITVEASDWVQLRGVSPRDPRLFSQISTLTFDSGKAGDITVSARQLAITGGGSLTSATLGSGAGGDVTVNATDSVELVGVEPLLLAPSVVSSATFNEGNAGRLTINTSRLVVREGGRADSSTLASGAAGSVLINASDSVEVSGTVTGSRNPSLVTSSANIVDEALQQLLGLSAVPSGVAGDVTLNTGRLRVLDGASVSVKNEGTGEAGNLQINAPSIFLENTASLAASTQSGNGGNINITSKDIRLLNGSTISATAGGTGNGGNINMGTDTLVLLNDSQITANAFEGQGGNINIRGQSLLVSPDSAITASSQLGSEGVIQLNINPFQIISADTGLPVTAASLEDLLAQTCSILSKRKDRLTIQGQGGAVTSPVSAYTLEDLVPSGQVFGVMKKSDGTVRLLSCDRLPS